MASSDIRQKAPFHFIRYASVWEDADILCEALAPVAKNSNLLSIASAGDNALALLTLEPSRVVAVDLNPSQLACLELRMAAFNCLDLEHIWAFLGVTPCKNRLSTYRKIRSELSTAAVQFWDMLPEAINQGVIHAGKFERYLRGFGSYILPLIHSKTTRQSLFEPRSLELRHKFYNEVWNNWRWRMFFQVFFSRFLMGKFGRDPAFFDHVQGRVSSRILKRTHHALTALNPSINPYLQYIVLGNYGTHALPRYLRSEHFHTIRSHIHRIVTKQCPVEASGYGPFKGFNLSDLFEYLDIETFDATYEALLKQSEPGARLVYWNMLVPRRCPKKFANHVKSLESLAKRLHEQDMAWFYQAFVVEEVTSWMT